MIGVVQRVGRYVVFYGLVDVDEVSHVVQTLHVLHESHDRHRHCDRVELRAFVHLLLFFVLLRNAGYFWAS